MPRGWGARGGNPFKDTEVQGWVGEQSKSGRRGPRWQARTAPLPRHIPFRPFLPATWSCSHSCPRGHGRPSKGQSQGCTCTHEPCPGADPSPFPHSWGCRLCPRPSASARPPQICISIPPGHSAKLSPGNIPRHTWHPSWPEDPWPTLLTGYLFCPFLHPQHPVRGPTVRNPQALCTQWPEGVPECKSGCLIPRGPAGPAWSGYWPPLSSGRLWVAPCLCTPTLILALPDPPGNASSLRTTAGPQPAGRLPERPAGSHRPGPERLLCHLEGQLLGG